MDAVGAEHFTHALTKLQTCKHPQAFLLTLLLFEDDFSSNVDPALIEAALANLLACKSLEIDAAAMGILSDRMRGYVQRSPPGALLDFMGHFESRQRTDFNPEVYAVVSECYYSCQHQREPD